MTAAKETAEQKMNGYKRLGFVSDYSTFAWSQVHRHRLRRVRLQQGLRAQELESHCGFLGEEGVRDWLARPGQAA